MATKNELIEQNTELLAINQKLMDDVPKIIKQILNDSPEVVAIRSEIAQAQATTTAYTNELSNSTTNHQEIYNKKIADLEAKKIEIMNACDVRDGELAISKDVIQVIHDQKLVDLEAKKLEILKACNTRDEELVTSKDNILGTFSKSEKTLIAKQKQFFDEYEARKNEVAETTTTGVSQVKSQIDAEIRNFTKLRDQFQRLASNGLNSKAGDLITQAYAKIAENHQKRETFFQIICGISIAAAITVLLFWLDGAIETPISENSKYYWLPIATITSLFLFLARWSARIAYRHGLEARRLNQYSLDLSTMPAYFSQELLNQGDKAFESEGKRIIQATSEKLFGNIERFDEQHTHSVMELVWKWLTNKFETELPISQPPVTKPAPKKKSAAKKKPSTEDPTLPPANT